MSPLSKMQEKSRMAQDIIIFRNTMLVLRCNVAIIANYLVSWANKIEITGVKIFPFF